MVSSEKSDTLNIENDKVYGLYDMREYREDDYSGLYIGDLMDYDANAKEEYFCNRLKADRYKACMGLHYTNDPMFHAYAIKYNDNENECV